MQPKFSDINAWIDLTDVPPKEFRWPRCTGWSLGWCRMLPIPVSILSYVCCPVVVVQCSTLCHTQCNRSPAWREQWSGAASEVCFSLPFHMSDHSDQVESLLALYPWHIDVLLEWKVRAPPQPKEFCWLLHWQKYVSNPPSRRHLSAESGCSEIYDLTLVGCKPETIPRPPFLWHLPPAVNVSLWCTGSAHKIRLPDHQQRVLWRFPWQYKRAAK